MSATWCSCALPAGGWAWCGLLSLFVGRDGACSSSLRQVSTSLSAHLEFHHTLEGNRSGVSCIADVAQILNTIEQSDPSAAGRLLPLVHDERRKLSSVTSGQAGPGPSEKKNSGRINKLGIDDMSKLEYTIVGILLGGACAWLSFVACWWTAAMVHMYVGGVSVNMVIVAALGGLLVGIVLDVLFLRRWIRGFYAAPLRLLAIAYGALCVVATASFMGLPVGTFALGLLAGAYAGRRQIHNPSDDIPGHGLRRVAFFAALLTAGAALPIGLLALHEQSVTELFRRILGISSMGAGVVVVCFLCMVLFGMQYWCSLGAGGLALRIGIRSAQPDGAAYGNQPIRSEGNTTSSAAGSRR